MDKKYLGDGVYVAHDGYGIILTSENGVTVLNTIYLEPEVLSALFRYLDQKRRSDMNATKRSLHILMRGRVTKAGLPTYDIMIGDGNPENWDMFAERIEGKNRVEMIVQAVNHFQEITDALVAITFAAKTENLDKTSTAWKNLLDECVVLLAKAKEE